MHHFQRDFTSSSNSNGVATPNATSINRRQPRTTSHVAVAFLKRSWTVTANHNAAAHPIRNVNVAAAVLKRVSQVGTASAHMTQALGTTTQISLIRDSGGEKNSAAFRPLTWKKFFIRSGVPCMGPNFIFAPLGLARRTLGTSFSAAASLHSVFDSALMKMRWSFSRITFVPPNVNPARLPPNACCSILVSAVLSVGLKGR